MTRESERRFCELPTVETFSRNEVGARDNENEVVLTHREKRGKAHGRVVCTRLT